MLYTFPAIWLSNHDRNMALKLSLIFIIKYILGFYITYRSLFLAPARGTWCSVSVFEVCTYYDVAAPQH